MSLQKYLDQLTPGKNAGSVAITVTKAMYDRDVHFFGQIYNHPVVVAALAGASATPEQKAIYGAMRLLTYGVWKDLAKEDPAVRDFITKAPELRNKLRQLSLLSVAEKTKNIPYAALAAELGLDAESKVGGDASGGAESSVTRELEDIVIDSTTAGLITVTLNPQKQQVQVHDAAARDVSQSEVPQLLALFKQWGARCEAVVDQLGKAQEKVHAAEQEDTEHILRMCVTEQTATRKALRNVVEHGGKASAI